MELLAETNILTWNKLEIAAEEKKKDALAFIFASPARISKVSEHKRILRFFFFPPK